jgi:2-C-methyl-D-erythritol 4-phosphate cytidylyltransferase
LTNTQSTSSVSTVIPAAGCGSRAGLGGNKILAPLCGRPVLEWTLRALLQPDALPPRASHRDLVLAARRDEWALIEPIARRVLAQIDPGTRPELLLVEGGATRQDSVAAAARVAQGRWVCVHDAARPLVSPELSRRVLEAVASSSEPGSCFAGAIAALPASDTVKMAVSSTGGEGHAHIEGTLDRACVWLAQTPQVFERRVLLEALAEAQRDGFIGTDCASLVERLRDEAGRPRYNVALVPGEPSNFKITFGPDIERAEFLLRERS